MNGSIVFAFCIESYLFIVRNRITSPHDFPKYAMQRLHCELPNAAIRQIPECGHLPHVEKPNFVAKLITQFIHEDSRKEVQYVNSG